MALKPIDGADTSYRDMIAQLLPRGPVWDVGSQPGLFGMVDGLSQEVKRIHGRLCDLMREMDPRTASELIDEWVVELDLPNPCNVMPTTLDGIRAMLALKLAALGGQDRDYFIGLVYAALDPSYLASGNAWVTIEERPYGRPFRVDESSVDDPLNDVGAMGYWRVHLPEDIEGTEVAEVIECLLGHYGPAHMIVEFAYDTDF